MDDCCRLVLPYNAVYSIQQTGQIPNDPPQKGAKSTTTSNHPSTPVDNQMVQHKNYVTERKDRLSGKSGGGILCYVRENIQYKKRLDLENLLVCFFYRPPD